MSARSHDDLERLGKANDLTDEQIQGLWVPFSSSKLETPFFKPASPMATILLGGKGSGKTHLLRYYSFPVQALRYADAPDWTPKLEQDGYVGVYTRAGGLEASRFSGKGVSQEKWLEVFTYYVELWLAQRLLDVIARLAAHVPDLRARERAVVERCIEQFDTGTECAPTSFEGLAAEVQLRRRSLDSEVSDVVFSNRLRPQIDCVRGSLVFGMPQIICDQVPSFSGLTFCFHMDEYENFTAWQQEYFNTLLRERQPPVTFRVGARLYGMKTYTTLSDSEELKDGSEYDKLRLDSFLRQDPTSYKHFAKELLHRRISTWAGERAVRDLEDYFQHSAQSIAPVNRALPPHTSNHREGPAHVIRRNLKGIATPMDIETVVSSLRYPKSPLVERAAIYAFYQEFARGRSDFLKIAKEVEYMKNSDLSDKGNHLNKLLLHFGDDFRAQLFRTRRQRFTPTLTLDAIITMSEGLPRVFLTIMKHIFSWAEFERGALVLPEISLVARRRGILEAARWFQHDMPQAGSEGEAIVTCVSRVAELFRINRYSDKPTECSLIAFSTPVEGLSEVSRLRLRESEHRSFLIRLPSGERDRSLKQVRPKYQLNKLLCTMFDLPIARRGTARLKADDVDAIFGTDDDAAYRVLRRRWSSRRNWPFTRHLSVSDHIDEKAQTHFEWDS